MFNQLKMINQVRKAQKELAKEVVEVEAGGGAVSVQITAELKVKQVKIDPARVDVEDIRELERWLESAVNDGFAKAQQIAAEKMQPLLGQMGLGGDPGK